MMHEHIDVCLRVFVWVHYGQLIAHGEIISKQARARFSAWYSCRKLIIKLAYSGDTKTSSLVRLSALLPTLGE